MKNESYGPSWQDCEEALDNAHARFKRPIQISVGWPVRLQPRAAKLAWSCSVSFYKPGDGAFRHVAGSKTFGYNGEYKTAPAALYNAILDSVKRMEEEGLGWDPPAA